MNFYSKTTASTFLLFALINLSSASTFSMSSKAIYIVIIDDTLPLYKRVLSGISIESESDFVEFSLGGNKQIAKNIIRQALKLKPSAIVAVGPKSANAAKAFRHVVPVIFCLVPKPENYDLLLPNIVGIRLEPELNKQIDALLHILPRAKNIGIVYDPNYSSKTIQNVKRAIKNQGLTFVPISITNPNEALKRLESLSKPIDVLWMISDSTSLHLKSWEATKQFSLKYKVPYFALDDGFVARGALFSFSLDYVRLGKQVARLTSRITQSKTTNSFPNIIEPEGIDLSINMTTAKTLNQSDEISVNILNYAANNQHSVQPLH